MKQAIIIAAIIMLAGCGGVRSYNTAVASNILRDQCEQGDTEACKAVLASTPDAIVTH